MGLPPTPKNMSTTQNPPTETAKEKQPKKKGKGKQPSDATQPAPEEHPEFGLSDQDLSNILSQQNSPEAQRTTAAKMVSARARGGLATIPPIRITRQKPKPTGNQMEIEPLSQPEGMTQ
jgi:hypothetical protein